MPLIAHSCWQEETCKNPNAIRKPFGIQSSDWVYSMFLSLALVEE